MSKVRAFRLYGKTELEQIRSGVEHHVTDWLNAWMPEPLLCTATAADVGARGVHGLQTTSLRAYKGADESVLLMSCPPSALGCVANAIAGFAEPEVRAPLSPLVTAMVEEALSDLARHLLGAAHRLDNAVDDLPTRLSSTEAAGSGAVSIELDFADVTLKLVAPAEVVRRYLSDSRTGMSEGALVPLVKALGDKRLSADLVLGQSELTLAELASLSEGDVILLERKIDESFELRTTTGKKVAPVQLGKMAQRLVAAVKGT